jgi:hypothetical protein
MSQSSSSTETVPVSTRDVLCEFANNNCAVFITLGDPVFLGSAPLGLSLIRIGSGDSAVYRGTLTGPLRRKLNLSGWECRLVEDEDGSSRCVAHGAIGDTGAIEIPLDAEELDSRPGVHIDFALSPTIGGDEDEMLKPQEATLAAETLRIAARSRMTVEPDESIDTSDLSKPIGVNTRVTRLASDFPVGLVLMIVRRRHSTAEIGRRFVHTTQVELNAEGIQCRTLIRSARQIFPQDLSDAECYLVPASSTLQFKVADVETYLANPCTQLHPDVRKCIEAYMDALTNV